MTDAFKQFQNLLKSRDYKAALKLAEKQLLDNQGAFWLTQQAKVLARQKKYALSLKAAEQAVNLEPANNYAILAVADALLGLNRHVEAAAYYREIITFPRLQSTAEKRIMECLAALKKWKEILEFSSRIELTTEEILPFKIKALAGLKQVPEAITVCREWLQLKPHWPPALWELVELEIARDGIEVVLNNMERMARIPSLPPVYKEIYVSLCERTGQHAIARKQLEELKARTSDPWIQKRNAYNLAKSGQEIEALPLLEELMQIEPEDNYLHACYAAACKRIGRLEQALAFYRDLLVNHPEARSLYGRIKRIKKQLGDK